MKTISIIIVNHNGEKFLERLFKTIYNQTFQDFEVIFVDNESIDSSVQIVRKNYPEIKIIKSENKGYGFGCNLGAKNASGELLVFLNEDMYLPPDFLEKMLQFRQQLLDQDKIGGISCKMVDFDQNPDDFLPTFGARIDFFGFPVKNNKPGRTLVISGSPFFISKDLFQKIGGFNELIFIYGEDVDLSLRLFLLGYRNYTFNDAYIYHFGGGSTGNLSPRKITDIVYGAFISIFTNYNLIALILILPLFIFSSIIFYFLITILRMDNEYLKEAKKKIQFFRRNVKKAHEKRKFVLKKRIRNRLGLIRYISFIPAFIVNKSVQKLDPNYSVTNKIK